MLYQYNRLVVHEWSLRYLGEFLATQIGMATPPIFVLGAMGLVALLRGHGGTLGARVLVNAMVWPIFVYFVWHTFHGRVEGNWPEPIFVAFVIAAAVAAECIPWSGGWASLASWSQRLAVPVGLGIAALIYAQAVFGVFPLGPTDPTAHTLGPGWKQLGVQMDEVRQRLGAPVVLTLDYGLASWLAFYMPSHPPVEQINGRIRYVNAPEPDPALFRRHDHVCVHGRVRRYPESAQALCDGGAGGRLEPDPAWRRSSGLSRLQHAGSDRAAA